MADKKKTYKKGIVYLSFIPPFMSVTKLSQLMSLYGKVGRIYLQPVESKDGKKSMVNKRKRLFTEGWVEFLKKKVAKEVAVNLNNKPIGGKKSNMYHDYLWNIKYLQRFKWIHLSERLSYERAVFKQRLQMEIHHAKRLATQFLENVEIAERLEKKKNKNVDPPNTNEESTPVLKNQFKQRETDSEKAQKSKFKQNIESREEFLKSIFAEVESKK